MHATSQHLFEYACASIAESSAPQALDVAPSRARSAGARRTLVVCRETRSGPQAAAFTASLPPAARYEDDDGGDEDEIPSLLHEEQKLPNCLDTGSQHHTTL